MNYKYTFTIFTPTYNRAHTLLGVYNSLKNQTYRDFEWLIVDDGSTDNTEELVKNWNNDANFLIRYIKQENGGKHRAFNRGVKEAQGELFLTLDSDDKCVDNALERFKYHWDSIPTIKKDEFSAVTSLCMDTNGNIIGDKFPMDVFDSNSIIIRDRHEIKGEKWGFQKTDILKAFPFPEFKNEKFITESIVWNKISLKYRTRFINEKLRIYEISNDSLSASSIIIRAKNPHGSTNYYNDLLDMPLSLKSKLKAAINYVRFSVHGRYAISTIFNTANSRLLVILTLPLGLFFYAKDLKEIASSN